MGCWWCGSLKLLIPLDMLYKIVRSFLLVIELLDIPYPFDFLPFLYSLNFPDLHKVAEMIYFNSYLHMNEGEQFQGQPIEEQSLIQGNQQEFTPVPPRVMDLPTAQQILDTVVASNRAAHRRGGGRKWTGGCRD